MNTICVQACTYLVLIIGLLLGACNSSKLYISGANNQRVDQPPPQSELFYSIFLVGDAGKITTDSPNAVLQLLTEKTALTGEQSTVIFLGDNIYPAGMPAEDHRLRAQSENRLILQMDAVKNHPGNVFFLPGNHDWDNSGTGGLQNVNRQEEFVEAYLNKGNTFLPDNGFPGPIDIELVEDDDTPFNKDIRLVVLDTQWWLHEHEKSFGDTEEYDLQDAGDFLVELNDIIRKRTNDHVIIAAHHPLYSNGSHGGYFPPKRHLLPPVLGSLYILYRKFFGFPQDISHHRYQELKRELTSIIGGVPNLIYASGHDHNLQYHRVNRRRLDQHFLVSGGGSKKDYVAAGMGAEFTYPDKGFLVIRYYKDGSSWLEAWAPGTKSKEGQLLYQTQLGAPDEDPFYEAQPDSLVPPQGLEDSTITIAANPKYDTPGPVFRALMGSHNRKLWSIPVEVPVFDIETVEGGLKAIKLGGKGQSNTLRMQNKDGHEFVLRTVDKVAGKIWDEELRQSLAEDLAQDQFAMLNPYGAFMVPPLAEAVGVYHTNPQLYYIPHDPRLGAFARQAGGRLALFEERPDDDMSHAPHFGNSEEVISTRAMLSEVEGDLDHQVDQGMMLRNRLLDMWISDWDRHEDQWRWASFEPGTLDSTLLGDAATKGKIYRPIPRDRDVAFMRMNGVIPSMGKLSAFKLYQDFTENYGNLKGLTMNSLALTRRFTNQLTWEQWQRIAAEFTQSLTDDVINQSVARLPAQVEWEVGETIREMMKSRREKLPEVARKYYELTNRVVDVVGSHKKEYFEIERLNAEQTIIRVFKRGDKDETDRKAYYERMFYSSVTEEIRIYGMGDNDEFEIKGVPSGATLIRIVGGTGDDQFYAGDLLSQEDATNIKLYDTAEGTTWVEVQELDLNTTDRTVINRYNYSNGFGYNLADPLLFLGHNNDDGVFIGGGAAFTVHGFQKFPHTATHNIRANMAARTGAFNIRYNGRFTEIAGLWDGTLDLHVLTPNNFRNFLGLGNESEETTMDNDNYYKARLWQYRVAPSLQRRLASGIDFSAGPFFQVTDVRDDDGRFIGQPQSGVSPGTFENQWYTGLQAHLLLENLDNDINPKQGFRLANRGAFNLAVKNTSDTHTTLGSALTMYLSPSLHPQLTLATRIGAEHIIGSFPFYEANSLGGKMNLRGLRSTRYNGRTNFFNNVELRGKLVDLNSYLLAGEVGLLGFVDHGRVWTDGEKSKLWHVGYGGGAWINIYKMTVIRTSIGFAEDEWNVLVGAGFFF